MTQALANKAAGRVLLHLVSMVLDHQFRWHWAGIKREVEHA